MNSVVPTDPIQALLAQTSLERNLFTSTSRYYGLSTTSMTARDGRTTMYLTRRFIPQADSFQLLQNASVIQGQRLDNLAAHYLGDPELFWQIADANSAMRPEELLTPLGRKLRITLPQGITGNAL